MKDRTIFLGVRQASTLLPTLDRHLLLPSHFHFFTSALPPLVEDSIEDGGGVSNGCTPTNQIASTYISPSPVPLGGPGICILAWSRSTIAHTSTPAQGTRCHDSSTGSERWRRSIMPPALPHPFPHTGTHEGPKMADRIASAPPRTPFPPQVDARRRRSRDVRRRQRSNWARATGGGRPALFSPLEAVSGNFPQRSPLVDPASRRRHGGGDDLRSSRAGGSSTFPRRHRANCTNVFRPPFM
jgi:hypothetical protein